MEGPTKNVAVEQLVLVGNARTCLIRELIALVVFTSFTFRPAKVSR